MRLDVLIEFSAFLFSLKNNEEIIMNVVCCSCDWGFKGLDELVNFQGKLICYSFVSHLYVWSIVLLRANPFMNPITLRKVTIVCNFGLSECNGVKE